MTMVLLATVSIVSCGKLSSKSDVEDMDKLFPDGMAILQKNGEVVGVKPSGEIVHNPGLRDFDLHEGLAVVKRDYSRYCFVDKEGNEVLDLEYPEINPRNPVAKYISYRKGNLGFNYFHPVYFPSGDTNNPQYYSEEIGIRYFSVSNFNNGRCLVRITKELKLGNPWCRFLDKKGNIIADDYFEADEFSEGFAPVNYGDGHYSYGKWMYIDTSGTLISPVYFSGQDSLPFSYEDANRFHNGFAIVGEGIDYYHEKYGVINRKFEQVIPCIYDSIRDFEDGLFAVKKGNRAFDGVWGYVDSTGKVVIPVKYNSLKSFSDGLAAVQINDVGAGFIDRNNNIVIPLEYDYVSSFDHGVAKVSRGGYTWYINAQNEEIKLPKIEYDEIMDFYKGVAIVKKHDMCGVIDISGKEIIPTEYDNIVIDKNGFIWVDLKGKWGVVSRKNKILIPIEFDCPFDK